MEDESWPALATLLRQIEALECEIAILDKEVEKLSETPRYKDAARTLVAEIKGVGLLTAMVFLTEMGDMSRFSNRQQVGAFLGLVPSSNESGENDDRKGHITREGSSRLRRVLCQASWSRVVHDHVESEVYDRIVRRNPKHKNRRGSVDAPTGNTNVACGSCSPAKSKRFSRTRDNQHS